MYIMNTNTAQIYTPLLVFLSSFTVTIAPPLCGLRQGSPVGPFTPAPVFQPPHGFLGLFLKFSVKTLLLTYKFFCSKLRSDVYTLHFNYSVNILYIQFVHLITANCLKTNSTLNSVLMKKKFEQYLFNTMIMIYLHPN